MLSLLSAAQPYLPYFYGIRVSTRPDYIDGEVLELLKSYGVTAIELGAQSMDDSVLELNERGHTARDVIEASRLIRAHDISLGLQMMTGLYGSTPEKDIETARRFVAIRPDTVRVYPTVILRGTELEQAYLDGRFIPYTLGESVELCSKLILLFAKADIDLIRLGLHYSESLEKNSLGNNYHPAFKELCENRIFLESFIEKARGYDQKRLTVTVNPRSLSKFLGQKKSNMNAIEKMGYEITVLFDDTLGKYELGVCNAT